MMKCLLILPYYGQFNNYFDIWLESCRLNKIFDWLILTDIRVPRDLPSNVKVIKKSFNQLKDDFKKKLKLNISLEQPYKLCDYKPFYGYLFEEYLDDYDFWGYCDCDLIFGDISNFLDASLFENYDKILRTGHLSFIRNVREINENFRNYETYKMTLTSPVIYGYDESVNGFHLGFAGELLNSGYRVFRRDDLVADVDFRHYPFHVVTAPEEPCVFSYENGKIYRIDRLGNSFGKSEMMYLHLQKRKMNVSITNGTGNYLIYPNVITNYCEEKLKSDAFWSNATTEREGYFDPKRERAESRKRDLLRLLHEPKKVRSIVYRIKG